MDERQNPQDLPPLELLRAPAPFRDFRESLGAVLGLGPKLKFTVPKDLPPLELLKPQSRLLDLRENLRAVLGLGPRPKFKGVRTAETDALTEATREPFPVRGFLYSCLVHQVVLFLLIVLPPLVPVQRKKFEFDRWIPLDTHLTFPFPRLEPPREKTGHEGGGKPGGKSGGGSPEKGADSPAPAPKEGGLVYPAPIEAVSNPPNPTNRIQTILQPDLPNPPELKVPIPLPNIVKVKRGAPPPLVPKVDTPLALSTPEAPKLTLPRDLAKLLPKSMRTAPPPALVPKVKKLPAEQLPEAPTLALAGSPPDMTRLSRKSTAPPPVVPKVNAVASPDPAIEAPKLAVESRAPGTMTFDRGLKAPPPPLVPKVSAGAVPGGTGTAPAAPTLSAQAASAVMPGGAIPGGDPRGRGTIPPLVPKVNGTGSGSEGGSGSAAAAPNLALPPGAGGTDDRNLLVLSPTPGTGGDVPFGEARGQFAMGPNPNLRGVPGLPPGRADGIEGGTGTGPGDSKGTGKGGTGTGGSGSGEGGTGQGPGGGGGGTGTGTGPGSGSGVGPGSGTGSGTGTGTGKGPGQNGTGGGGTGTGTGTGPGNGPGQGSGAGSGPGTGSGFGSGSGSGSSPFQGIYIAGVVGSRDAAAGQRSGSGHDVPRSPKTSYGMTIVSTAASGGGLRDYGIFHNEVVSTVYIEMTHSPTPAPSWTLQYAILHKDQSLSPDRLIGPFPIDKEKPQFPEEVVARNLGRLVVVYAEIDIEGKAVNMRIIQSPNPLLNAPVLEALAKWAFRPAEFEGKPIAVKALLGIPLSLPPT